MSFHCCLFQSSFDASIKLKEQVERSGAPQVSSNHFIPTALMKTFQLFSVSSRPQLSSPASLFTTAVCLITSISTAALSIGLGPSLASDFGGNCLQRRLANWELRLRSGPHTHLPNRIDFSPSQFLQSKPSEAPPPARLSGEAHRSQHIHTRAHFGIRWNVSLKPPHAHYICLLPPPPFLSFSASSLLGFVASKLGQLGSLGSN